MVGQRTSQTTGCSVAKEPCVNATLWETNRGMHLTDDKLQPCQNCTVILTHFENLHLYAKDLDFELT